MNILRIDGSARFDGSVTRQLADQVVQRLLAQHPDSELVQRELSNALPVIDESWVTANFTDPADRSDEQHQTLALSDSLVAELKVADLIVLAVPVYNFGVPAAVKAWVDLVCRARETFRYGPNGPEGLLQDRPVYLVSASGGTAIGGEMDFATPYLRHVLGFIGLKDIRLIEAGQLAVAADSAMTRAGEQLDAALAKAA